MTNPNIIHMRAELATVDAALATVLADVELYERLRSASRRAANLTKERDALASLLAETEAAEDKASSAATFAQFNDITVHYAQDAENVLKARWIIRYERLTYDSNLHMSVMKWHEVSDFDRLPPEAYCYLVEVRPERIPSLITDLAPGDPQLAFQIYFAAKQRGYLNA